MRILVEAAKWVTACDVKRSFSVSLALLRNLGNPNRLYNVGRHVNSSIQTLPVVMFSVLTYHQVHF